MKKLGRRPVDRKTRFMRFVKVEGECWLWQGFIFPTGYGNFMWESGKYMGAHRASLMIFKELPAGLNALHKCHVKHCVNPDHLYAGTQKDNMRQHSTVRI